MGDAVKAAKDCPKDPDGTLATGEVVNLTENGAAEHSTLRGVGKDASAGEAASR